MSHTTPKERNIKGYKIHPLDLISKNGWSDEKAGELFYVSRMSVWRWRHGSEPQERSFIRAEELENSLIE